MKRYIIFNDKETLQKFLMNILLFTAPSLAAFFGQLAVGVDWKIAAGVALLALWGLLADYFKKIKQE